MSTPDIDLDHLTASTAARELRAGLYSAETLVRACLSRIERANPTINALVALDRNAAIAAARAADERLGRGDEPPPLLGVPISVKDSFATRGLPTTASHRPLRNYRPPADATVVARLLQAGAVLLGKSNLPELAAAPHCRSPLFGATRNPWNLDFTPGGSSGGAAAAVASGFSLLEVGSDFGGSIRIPAAYCGIPALRATENRIPRSGHIPHLPPPFGRRGRSVWHMLSFGVLGRCVADLHLGYGLIAGPDGLDSTIPPFPPLAALPAAGARARTPLRIAVWTDFAGTPLCPRTRQAFSNMVRRLEAAGHAVSQQAPADFDVTDAWDAFGTIGGCELGLGLPAWQRLLGLGGRLLPRDHRITRAFMRGLGAGLARYNQALNRREALIHSLENFLARWDLVLCPVAATAPYRTEWPRIRLGWPRLPVGESQLPYLEAAVSMAIPFSLTGSPVVVLPLGTEEGLPVGVQAIGKRWEEDILLAHCHRLEEALGGFVPPPGLGPCLAS